MKKVLIIGPSFFYYNHSIGNAFEKLGFDTKIVEYDEPVHPFNLKNKILNKVLMDKAPLQKKSRETFNAFIIKEFALYSPELVFIYNGDILEPETIQLFRKSSKVAIWALDGVYRHPRSVALAPLADAYFCFEQDDVTYLTHKGIQAYFLPQACDTSIYYPQSLEKDIDILFVGALYGYPTRIRLLKKVVETFPEAKIKIYGVYKPWYKNPLKWLFREKRNVFMNKNITPAEVNLLYNRSKVCINIHHEQSKNGANPKVFEISGARAFQLVDYNPYIASIFANGEVGFYHSDAQLLSLIEQHLSSNDIEIVQQAYDIIVSKHTFENRVSTVLSILKN